MPKIVDYEKKKKEIIQKAIQVFVQKGYHETKLSDIAQECGMGRTTLYQYFRNKDEIFYHAIKQSFKDLENECRKIAESSNLTFVDKIKKIVSKLATEYQKERNKMLILIEALLLTKRENGKMVGKINERVAKLRNIFKELLNEGIKAREIKYVNKESMAFSLYTLVESFVLQAAFAGEATFNEHLKNINLFIESLRA